MVRIFFFLQTESNVIKYYKITLALPLCKCLKFLHESYWNTFSGYARCAFLCSLRYTIQLEFYSTYKHRIQVNFKYVSWTKLFVQNSNIGTNNWLQYCRHLYPSYIRRFLVHAFFNFSTNRRKVSRHARGLQERENNSWVSTAISDFTNVSRSISRLSRCRDAIRNCTRIDRSLKRSQRNSRC